MFYHATSVKGIRVLQPRISNHNIPLIYFSDKRENVLVYLSNAVEKLCEKTGFYYEGSCTKWGPYGFDKTGILRFEEYYPNALEETYRGVSGYIYNTEIIDKTKDFDLNIFNAFVTDKPTKVDGCEYISDAYDEIIHAEKSGLIKIVRYDEFISKQEDWLKITIKEQYENSENHPEYRFFLKTKFPAIIQDNFIL